MGQVHSRLGRLGRHAIALISGVVAVAMLASSPPAYGDRPPPSFRVEIPRTIAAPTAGPPTRVPAALFGLHDASHNSRPIQAIRLWDDGSRWDQVSMSEGVYDWTRLDANVDSAQSRNASQILYVLGSTPVWAASRVDPAFYFGGGTASMPQSLDLWRQWVRDVAQRYKGRITSYQIWNEANMRAFFAGTPQDMAELTKIAAQEIRAIDPAAEIITASVVLKDQSTRWLSDYLVALQKTQPSIDGIGFHGYVWGAEGPGNGTSDQRREVVSSVRQVAADAGFTAPLWDTEVNFGNNRTNGWPRYSYSDNTALTMLSRSYVDSQVLGVGHQFWYAWDKQVMSVNLTEPSGSVTPVGDAFYQLQNWMAGKRWLGCRTRFQVLMCPMVSKRRLELLVMTARLDSPDRVLNLGRRPHYVCQLTSACDQRRTVHVAVVPQLVHMGPLARARKELATRPPATSGRPAGAVARPGGR